jgi:crotonobetainyl-CoA:carnitine CoA-transferase CaiB-like acyl-CoA transferase
VKSLAGVRVVDLTQAMAAPFCTMNLADHGRRLRAELPAGCGSATGRGRRHAGRARSAPDLLLLGQHTGDVLTELGYSEAEQRGLKDKGVI